METPQRKSSTKLLSKPVLSKSLFERMLRMLGVRSFTYAVWLTQAQDKTLGTF